MILTYTEKNATPLLVLRKSSHFHKHNYRIKLLHDTNIIKRNQKVTW